MKKIHLLKIICVSLILTTLSCKKTEETPAENKPAFDMASAKTTIENGYREFEKAFNSKDSVALANCYASDAKFMPQSSKAVEGRPAIQKEFYQWFKGETPQISIKLVEAWGNENNLTVENTWTMTGNDGKVMDEGKSLEIYKMEDGKWKILRDCFNSDLPPVK